MLVGSTVACDNTNLGTFAENHLPISTKISNDDCVDM